MKEIATLIATLMEDRDQLKWRVNIVNGERIIGFLKPFEWRKKPKKPFRTY